MAKRPVRKASVLIELSVANALASQLFDRELARLGVAPTQVGLLTLVSLHGPATTTGLQHESGLPKTTLRERLQALESAGYVRRMPNPADGRSHFLGLTSAGNTFLRRVAPGLERVEHEIGHALGRPLESLRPDLEQLRGAEQALLSREEGELEEGPATAVVFR